jgi:hypothetical protein
MFEILQAHLSKEAAPLDQVRTDVPPELAAVAAKMMAKDPARRYQRPAEVVQALAPFVQGGLKATPGTESGSVVSAAPAASPAAGGTMVEGSQTIARALKPFATEPQRPEGVPPARKRPVGLGLIAAGVLGVLALGGGGLLLLNRDSKPEPAADAEQTSPRAEKAGPRKVPANLRTTVDFVNYEVAGSRFNGRVWELTLKVTSARNRRLQFWDMEVLTEDRQRFGTGRGKTLMEKPVHLIAGDPEPIKIKITMSTLPPTVTKLARVVLIGEGGRQEPVVFLDVPIEPDSESAGTQGAGDTPAGNTKPPGGAGARRGRGNP